MLKFFAPLVSLFLMASLTTSLQAQAEWVVQPSITWKTLNTAHFEVIYNAEQQELALLYADRLEKAYEILHKTFSVMPEKTIVVINDKTDLTNGYATRIPYPHIMTYPVLPGPEESLADTGDWYFELLSHEYTHVLNFEPATGFMKPLRYVFGSVVAPGLLLPRWWKEGLAVQMETSSSRFGRLRSVFQDAALRAMVQDNVLAKYTLPEINETLPDWPEGMRPYLFGSVIWSQMVADKGPGVVDELNLAYSRRVPFFLNGPAEDAFGHGYRDEYSKTLLETMRRADDQVKVLKALPPTASQPFQDHFKYSSAPTFSPNGRHFVIITEDVTGARSLKIGTRDKASISFRDVKLADTVEKFNELIAQPSQKDGPPTGSIQRVSWFPDSRFIVYDKIDITNKVERFSDLYTYDLKDHKTRRLSKGLRAREPAVSPDGQSVVFVKLEAGRTRLGILDIKPADPVSKIVFSPPLQERISYPIFLDDDHILYSLRESNGTEHLHTFQISTGENTEILKDFPNARFAHKTTEGIIFTSSKNGTHNVYLANSDLSDARPLTHTTTAFFAADIDPIRKELVATTMTSQGEKLVDIAQNDWVKSDDHLPQIGPLFADRYPEPTEDTTQTKLKREDYQIDDYSPASYLLPRYWIPFLADSSTDNGLLLQAQTSGFDPLQKHGYNLLGTWDTLLNKGSLIGTYLNQTTSLPWAVNLYSESSYLGNVSNEIDERGGYAEILPDMFWLSRYAMLQLGGTYDQRSLYGVTLKRTGPFAVLSYTNIIQSGVQVSPEGGGSAYVGVYEYVPANGYLSHQQYIGGTQIYLSKFLPSRHVFMIKLDGMYTPENIPSILGAQTQSMVYIPNNPLPEYIMRGFKTGQLFGKSLVNANLEYRFPLSDLRSGQDIWGWQPPYFLNRLHGALIADGLAMDGYNIDDITGNADRYQMSHEFWSVGAELRLDTTLGYTFPVTWIVGFYEAFNPGKIEPSLGTALQIGGF